MRGQGSWDRGDGGHSCKAWAGVLARAGRLINEARVSPDRKGSVTGQLSDTTQSVRI